MILKMPYVDLMPALPETGHIRRPNAACSFGEVTHSGLNPEPELKPNLEKQLHPKARPLFGKRVNISGNLSLMK